MNCIERKVTLVEDLLVRLSSVVLFLLMALAVLDALSRYFGFVLPGVFEFSELMMVGIAYLGLGYVTRRNTHIRATFIVGLMSIRVQGVVRALILLVSFAIFAAMLYATGIATYDSWIRGTARSGLVRFPEWPAKTAIVVSVTVLLLRLAIEIVKTIRGRTDEVVTVTPVSAPD